MRLRIHGVLLFALLALACAPYADRSEVDAGTGIDGGGADAGNPALTCDLAEGSTDQLFAGVVACLEDVGESSVRKRSAIARFVAFIEASGGFPLDLGEDVVFVYVRDAAYDVEDDATSDEDFAPARRLAPIRVVGDFDEWLGSPMSEISEGFFVKRVPLPAVDRERAGYKFVAKDGAGSDVWFSDPLSRRFDFDPHGRISLVRGGRTRGHLEWLRNVHATRLGNDRPISFWLPPAYDQSAASYPVFYLHDGNNLFDPAQPRSASGTWDADAVADTEIAAGRASPFVIVGVPNTDGRFEEYTHVLDDIGGGPLGGRGADYGDFLVRDLKPIIDARYRTRRGREDTAVLGSSLGGLVSFQLALEHADVFRGIGGMSSTFGWGRLGLQNETMLERYRAAEITGRDFVFYLDSGGGPGCEEGENDDNYCETLEMQDVLESKGFLTYPDDPDASPLTPAGVNIFHWHQLGAVHDEAAWHARLARPMRLFFPPE